MQDQFGAPDDGLITLESMHSIEVTALAIHEALSANGNFGIPLVLDYGDRDTRRESRWRESAAPILIVFGNPNVGTPLMVVKA